MKDVITSYSIHYTKLYESALTSFDEAESRLPPGEKSFAASKYLEMAQSLFDIASSATDSTVRDEALSAALEFANKSVEADPAIAATHYLKSQIYEAQKKNESAYQENLTAVKLDGGNYLYLYELGKKQYVRKQYSDAAKSFATVTKLKSDYEPAFFNLGMSYRSAGDVSSALAAFRGAIAVKSDYVKAHIEVARLLDRKGDFPGAATSYGTALKYEPGNVSALRELAALYSKQGEYQNAERYFKEALTLGADDSQTNYNMAAVQLELGIV